MRIDAYNQITQLYGVNAKQKVSAVAKTSKTDKVEISSFGRDLQIAKQAVANSSDIREDKVAKLKSQIDSGNYDVAGESFAEKLLAKYDEIMG